MYKEISVPYGHDTRTLRIPEASLAWVVGPNDASPVPDLAQAVRDALRSPIGAPTLGELVARHGKRTVLLVDDGTRATPQSQILPVLLDELNAAGVADGEIAVWIALGTHRPMSANERAARCGQAVMERVSVQNLSQDPVDFCDLGVTPSGVPIRVSRPYLESDLSIAVGSIMPHMYAGWGGGAKMVQPGMTDHRTTGKTHMMAGPHVYEILGEADNPVRREMEEIAVRSGLKFIVNVVLNRDGEVAGVVAGDVVAAHRAGVEIACPIYTVEVPGRADIVIGSSHPADRDLWQGFKPLNNCGMLAKDRGTLILLIPAPEGIAPDHPALLEFGQTPAERVLDQVAHGAIPNEVAAATYLALDQTRRRVNITLVTDGISRKEGARLGLTVEKDFGVALAGALARHGDGARIGVVTHGADIIGHVVQEGHRL